MNSPIAFDWHQQCQRLLEQEYLLTCPRQDIKHSIWADIAIAPNPLQLLQATWPQTPLPRALALMLVQSTVTALRITQHPDLSAVSLLLRQHS